jgi:hypothetical protein
LTESGLTGAYPLDRIDHPSIEVVRHGGHHDYRTEDRAKVGLLELAKQLGNVSQARKLMELQPR